MDFIEWCNNNNGFLTALLSLIGLTVSVIAVIVSIRTARLPYKKKLKLSASIMFNFEQDILTSKISASIMGLSANAINVGRRTINITFLGFAIRDSKGKIKFMQKTQSINEGSGVMSPTEIHSTHYSISDMFNALTNLEDKTVVYICAQDSEETIYKKKYGTAIRICEHLKSSMSL